MPETKSLELYEDKKGQIGKRVDKLKLGFFDVMMGMDRKFWIRNPIHNLIVDISNLHTTNPDSYLSAPSHIMPFETVRCSIRIKPMTQEEADEAPAESEFIDTLEGPVISEPLEFEIDGKKRVYGDEKY